MVTAKSSIAEIVQALFAVRQQKAALEKTEKILLDELKPLVDPEFDVHLNLGLPISESAIRVGNLNLSRTAGTSRSISADLLLERGVAAEIINYATKTTTYFQYRIKEAKD